ncbi:MAG: hypothetical protein A2Z18_01595 [Armatimonadetes bacterium RBG_16_58_9]|nr:MAG: hypothetical protein A2Z18_01595 [Armatimonadetes bacterium RBG_16_58_9]
MTIWGDGLRNSPDGSNCRQSSRLAAFVRGDVGLDNTQDWYIQLDVTNDFVSPDYYFILWLFGARPDKTWLNTGDIRDRMLMYFGVGDQLPNDNARAGFAIDVHLIVGGLSNVMSRGGSRLDPVPDTTQMRGGYNRVTVQWLAATQVYGWKISNSLGERRVYVAQSEINRPLPERTYFAAGTTDNGMWMATGWTVHSLQYGYGNIIPPPPPPPKPLKIGEAKGLPNESEVNLPGKIVTLCEPGSFYFVQESDRSAGIRVDSPLNFPLGTVRNIVGTMGTDQGERFVLEDSENSATVGWQAVPGPLGVAGRSIGGGQIGAGLDNLGLLLKTCGRVTYAAPDRSHFLIDDGSAIDDDPAGLGVRALIPSGLAFVPAVGSCVVVTGIGRPYTRSGGGLGCEIMPGRANDVQIVSDGWSRLAALREDLTRLQGLLGGVQSMQQDVSYPWVTFYTLSSFAGYVEEDLNYRRPESEGGGEDPVILNRALEQLGDLEKMAVRLESELREALQGERRFPEVPRWSGTTRPLIQAGSFVGPTISLIRDTPVQRPILFNGYGHFSQIRRDVDKFFSYGVNVIQPDIGPNAVFPAEGVIDTGPITEDVQVLNRAASAKVADALLISPHYFPNWMLDKYPHLRKQRAGFIQFCIHAPEGQDFLRNYIATLIPAIKDKPALQSIVLSNEPVNMEEPCQYATADWHIWLQTRHGSIATLNARWGTTYSSFEGVPLPNPMDQPQNVYRDRVPSPIWMEFIRFNQESFASWHQMLADAVRQYAPDLPVHVKTMTWSFLRYNRVVDGVDPYLFAKLSDINGNDSQYWYTFGAGEFAQEWLESAMGHDLQRSVKNAPIFDTETHVILDYEKRYIPARQVCAALWQSAVYGGCAQAIWVWERTFDVERHNVSGSIMHRPACAEAVGIVNHDLNRAAQQITAIQTAAPDVLILHSVSAMVWDKARYGSCMYDLYRALSFTGAKVGFVTERQLEEEIAPNGPVLFVPNVKHLSDSAFQTLQQRQGLTVNVGDADILAYNDYNAQRTGQIQAESLPYAYGQTTWHELWQSLISDLPAWGVHPLVQVLGANGEAVWGVMWRSANVSGGVVVSLCNYRNTPMSVRLYRGGQAQEATDVLSGQTVSGVITLQPLEVRLLLVPVPLPGGH